MTGLASSLPHIASTAARALFGSLSSRSSSMTLPWRTSRTPAKPRLCSAWPIALPWGSRTPDFKVTWMRAFIPELRSLHRLGALEIPRPAFGENPEPAGDLLIGFLDISEVAAEAVFVQLLVGLDVPKPAGVRA